MAHRSDPRFLVLHALRLKALAEPAAVADAVALSEDEVRERLAAAAADGFVTRREGRVAGWSLTAAGRARHQELLAADVEGCGCRDEIADSYRRFLTVNAPLLEACTAWQLRTVGGRQVANDHRDRSHDAAVLDRVHAIDDEIQPVFAKLGSLMERFATYGRRLSSALNRVDAGQADWLTRPMIGSYHTVWFELHEDLLVTLGIERSRENA